MVDLSQVASEVLSTLDVSDSANIIIENELMIEADEGLMRILLSNLLSNAVKYSSKVDVPTLHFGKKFIDGQEVFVVSDNGVGFKKSYSNKIFKPFQRLHTESEFSGMGIGLVTAKRIIARHGGEIWANGQADNGAFF